MPATLSNNPQHGTGVSHSLLPFTLQLRYPFRYLQEPVHLILRPFALNI